MKGDWRSRDREFEYSTVCCTDIFSHYIVRNCNVCLKCSKINDKEARDGQFVKNNRW